VDQNVSKTVSRGIDSVELWLLAVSGPDSMTRKMYLVGIKKFLKYINMEPKDFLKLAKKDPDTAKRLAYGFLSHLQKQGLAPKSIALYVTAVNSWLEFNGLEHLKIKRRKNNSVPQTLDYIPSLEEIEYIISRVEQPYKTILSLIAYSGIRPSDVVSLQLKNVSQDIGYDKEKQLYYIKRVPAVIILKQKKTGQWYCTFMGPKTAMRLVDWLNYFSREVLKQPLRDNDRLFDISSARYLIGYWNNVLKRLNIKKMRGVKRFRLYSLRKYFRRAVMTLGEDVAEYLMGHSKGINSLSATYSGLRDLDDEAIETLRQQFAQIINRIEGGEFVDPTIRDELDKLKRELSELKKRYDAMLTFENEIYDLLAYLDPDDIDDIADLIVKRAARNIERDFWQADAELKQEAMSKIKQGRQRVRNAMARLAETILQEKRRKAREIISKYYGKKQISSPTNNNGITISNTENNAKWKHVIANNDEELVKYLDMGYELYRELSSGKCILRKKVLP